MKKSPKGPWVIIIMTLLLVAVMLVLGNQSFKATEKAAFDEFNQRQLVLARGAAGGIELYFETLAGDLRALGRMPQVQHLDEAPTRREIQHTFDQLEPLEVNDVGVLDANGVLRCNVMAHQIEGVDFSWRRDYQEAKRLTSDDSYVVEFIEFKGVEAGQKGVLVAVPMLETATDANYPAPSGQFAGVVLCTLRLDTITQKFVAPIQSSERGHAFVIDDQHHVLWTTDRSLFGKNLLEEGQGFPAFQQIAERMSAGNSSAAEYSYYKYEDSSGQYTRDKKEENFIAYAPIHLGSEVWAIGVWAPKEDARQFIRSAYLQQLFVVGLSLLTILLGSSYSLAAFYRTSKFLEKEVETKTGELKESHERLLTVLDSLDAVVYVADMETYEILFVNKYLRNLFGDVVGQTCWQTVQVGQSGPCDFCTNEKLLVASGEPSTVYGWEFQNTVTGRWYEIRDRAIRWVDGRIVRLEIAIDITERVRVEEELRQYAERLRALAARLAGVAEAERQRLARELHDQVGQNLTALGINLNIVRAQMPEQAANSLHSRLDDSLSLVGQTAAQIRDVMANLRPPMLDDYGVVAALHWYGEQFARRTDIAIAMEGEEPVPRLATHVENALFRIAQEALTNVAKHAQATHVTVTVEVDSGTLRLVVADDGIGFDPSALPFDSAQDKLRAGPAHLAEPDGGRGWGLLTMTERAEAVGGRCRIESYPGQGAQVIVEVAR
jgi:PAS domain S-box-containing protein